MDSLPCGRTIAQTVEILEQQGSPVSEETREILRKQGYLPPKGEEIQ